jgi:leader peptidase (prepilin peptidase) / N-methyltransferase
MTLTNFLILIFLLGLLVGSFLNVVIYRLPLMLKNEAKNLALRKKFNLFFPRSHCPRCKKIIPFWLNIPIFSYFLLQGKCKFCGKEISLRYPLVEFFSAGAAFIVAYTFGISIATFALLLLTWALIALIFIDLETQLLPDQITIPLIWIGLLANSFFVFVPIQSAIIGAIAGYLSLWLIANCYQIIRCQEGMGYGDFKLFAVFGAWLGFKILPMIILLASILALVSIGSLMLAKKHQYNLPFSFGPYLALAGWSIFVGREYFPVLKLFV